MRRDNAHLGDDTIVQPPPFIMLRVRFFQIRQHVGGEDLVTLLVRPVLVALHLNAVVADVCRAAEAHGAAR